jgi:hypothetical protein
MQPADAHAARENAKLIALLPRHQDHLDSRFARRLK